MRATLMYQAGDVRVEDVPDPSIVEPTDAVIRITRACICGSDLWPYGALEPTETGRPMGHEYPMPTELCSPSRSARTTSSCPRC